MTSRGHHLLLIFTTINSSEIMKSDIFLCGSDHWNENEVSDFIQSLLLDISHILRQLTLKSRSFNINFKNEEIHFSKV